MFPSREYELDTSFPLPSPVLHCAFDGQQELFDNQNSREIRTYVFLSLERSLCPYLDVVDEDLPEPYGQHVPGGLLRAVPDVGHEVHALEAAAHPVVDALGLPPVALQLVIAVALVARELLRALLHDLGAGSRGDRHPGA